MFINCENCGREFWCSPSRWEKNKHHCCSRECIKQVLQRERERQKDYFNCTCEVCGKKFHQKPYHANLYQGHTCSKECNLEAHRRWMTGKNNHQYGLNGYKQIRVLNHPFRTHNDWVMEHRLVAEKFLLTEDNSIEINGKRYLKPEYEVHHIDENRLNNSPSNLPTQYPEWSICITASKNCGKNMEVL